MPHVIVKLWPGKSEQQKARYLPDACNGKTRFCFAITEPDAGSNTIRPATMAKKRGNRFALSGQKTFITDADGANGAVLRADGRYSRWSPTADQVSMWINTQTARPLRRRINRGAILLAIGPLLCLLDFLM